MTFATKSLRGKLMVGVFSGLLCLAACGESEPMSADAPTVPTPPATRVDANAPAATETDVEVASVEVSESETEVAEANDHDHDDHEEHKHKHDDEAHEQDDHSHDDDGVGEAHVHGVSEMAVVIDGDTLSVSFSGPLYNVVGFEHAPKTPEQEQAMAGLRAKLGTVSTFVTVPTDANCAVRETDIDIENSGSHSALRADYTLECDNIDRIDTLSVSAFSNFEGLLKSIDAIAITPTGQSAQTLTASSMMLAVPN